MAVTENMVRGSSRSQVIRIWAVGKVRGKMDTLSQRRMQESGIERIFHRVNQVVGLTRWAVSMIKGLGGKSTVDGTQKRKSENQLREVSGFHFECVECSANQRTSIWKGNGGPLHRDSSEVGRSEETLRKRRIKP